jgi:hypothetical protein
MSRPVFRKSVFRSSPLVLAGTLPLLLAFGYAKPTSAARYTEPAGGKFTYSGGVGAILLEKCASCHRPGEVSPFSLLTYEDARKRAKQIALLTKSRFMPPWKADSHGEFVDERRLSDAQIAAIQEWADAGAPQGDPKAAPPIPKFPAGWKLGTPDSVVGLSEPYPVAAEGRDVYRCFVIPTNGTEDRFVKALEVHPGNRTIVHHVIAYLDTSGTARKLDAKDPGPGYQTSGGGPGFVPTGFLGGWAPGNDARFLPPGIGTLLPKGSDIVLEVHYHKSGKPETDQTQVGIFYAKEPINKRVRMLPIINPFFKIPAGAEDHVVNAGMPIFSDITVLGVTPHMHLLGKSMKVTATLPDNTQKQIVNVPDWDFNWQISYVFKEPMKLPAGTKLSLVAHYDNSPKNPHNPNTSPRDVTWGEQTTDEMCIAFLGYTRDDENLLKTASK